MVDSCGAGAPPANSWGGIESVLRAYRESSLQILLSVSFLANAGEGARAT